MAVKGSDSEDLIGSEFASSSRSKTAEEGGWMRVDGSSWQWRDEQDRGASLAGGGQNGRICFDFQRGNCKRINRGHPEDRNITPINVVVDLQKRRQTRKSYNRWKSFLACEPTDSSVAISRCTVEAMQTYGSRVLSRLAFIQARGQHYSRKLP